MSATIEESVDQHDATRSTIARLLFLGEGDVSPPEVVLSSDAVRVGRSDDCELTLNTACISRHHATLEATESGWVLRDRGSTNGTRVNQKRVSEALLTDGDVVAFANIEFRFVDGDEALDAPATQLLDEADAVVPSFDVRRRAYEQLLCGLAEPVRPLVDSHSGETLALFVDGPSSKRPVKAEWLLTAQGRGAAAAAATSTGVPTIVVAFSSDELTGAAAAREMRVLRAAAGGPLRIAAALSFEQFSEGVVLAAAEAGFELAVRDYAGGDPPHCPQGEITWMVASERASRSAVGDGERAAMWRRRLAAAAETGLQVAFQGDEAGEEIAATASEAGFAAFVAPRAVLGPAILVGDGGGR